MIFGHHATASAAHRRRAFATTNALTAYEADLTHRDRAKQKEAVKKFLSEKVQTNWTWKWPRPDPDSSPEHSYTPGIAEEHELWKERDEWESNASESESEANIPGPKKTEVAANGPFRFETPDGVGDVVKKSERDRKRRRQKRLREEMIWNDGVRCFVQRRDAWTGARRVPRSTKLRPPPNPIKRESLSSEDGSSSTAIEPYPEDEWEEDTEIPIAPPLIPPENAMRATITPVAYNTIYDKVILQQLTPSCPMNLRDVTRSCVQGWKRDGEWPPKSSVPDTSTGKKKKTRKLSVASLFGLERLTSREEKEKLEKEKEAEQAEKAAKGGERDHSEPGGIRRSIQRILKLGKEHAHTNGNGKSKDGHAVADINVA